MPLAASSDRLLLARCAVLLEGVSRRYSSTAVYCARFVEVQQCALFTKDGKSVILRNPKRSSFITFCFEFLFDTATLTILNLEVVNATGCKQKCKSELLHRILYAQ